MENPNSKWLGKVAVGGIIAIGGFLAVKFFSQGQTTSGSEAATRKRATPPRQQPASAGVPHYEECKVIVEVVPYNQPPSVVPTGVPPGPNTGPWPRTTGILHPGGLWIYHIAYVGGRKFTAYGKSVEDVRRNMVTQINNAGWHLFLTETDELRARRWVW